MAPKNWTGLYNTLCQGQEAMLTYGWTLEVVKRNDDVKSFVVMPKRWVVERTFAWLGHFRRLSKDYEYLPTTSEAMIYAAMVHLMLRRLAPARSAIAR